MIETGNLTPPEFVDRVLREALAAGASDVYWIPGRGVVAVRQKVAGAQCVVAEIAPAFGEQCIARIKVMAGLLTYRTGIAQDGVIRELPGLPAGAELRVASLPTAHGERLTIRLLDRQRTPQRLDDLGYAPAVAAALRALLAQPGGMLVLTGPTGSGKTTTIYALVRELLGAGEDPAGIITIEDPVECEIAGISQVQVTRAGSDWGYAQALRAALRHDVKTLVIGEMRDRDVARVALEAALTGHRVITTFHAGDIAAVYARLLHQGFEPFLVAAAVTGVLSQRLCRRAAGAGMVPVAAVLAASDEWREFVTANPRLGELRRKARTIAGADLAAAGAALAAQGVIPQTEASLI